jgi:hypothetical protein
MTASLVCWFSEARIGTVMWAGTLGRVSAWKNDRSNDSTGVTLATVSAMTACRSRFTVL